MNIGLIIATPAICQCLSIEVLVVYPRSLNGCNMPLLGSVYYRMGFCKIQYGCKISRIEISLGAL